MGYFSNYQQFFNYKEVTPELLHTLRCLATKQFLSCYAANKDRNGDPWLWGTEFECVLLRRNEKGIYLLDSDYSYEGISALSNRLKFMPEFASFMLEFTPSSPFHSGLRNIRERCNNYIEDIASLLSAVEKEGFFLLLGTCHPLFGRDFLYNSKDVDANRIQELKLRMLSQVTKIPRYNMLLHNILDKRGSIPWITISHGHGIEKKVYLPGPLFGMGLCGLHVTMQCTNLEESRFLYDALQALCPILVALSASTSVLAGLILNNDTRITYITEAMDDRTQIEHKLGLPARYGIAHTYLSNHCANACSLADRFPTEAMVADFSYMSQCYDDNLSSDSLKVNMHLRSILAHWPLAIACSVTSQQESDSLDCWEQFQSLTWQSCRWKPPSTVSPMDSTGWRVELRCMEIQYAISENVAYSVFVYIISCAIRDLELILYIPHSFILQDMLRAETRDSIISGTFWVRDIPFSLELYEVMQEQTQTQEDENSNMIYKKAYIEKFASQISTALQNRKSFDNLKKDDTGLIQANTWCPQTHCMCQSTPKTSFHLIKLTAQQFVCGCECYPGILPILRIYVHTCYNSTNNAISTEDYEYILLVLSYIEGRASGLIPTCAAAARRFLQNIRRKNDDNQESSLTEGEANSLVQYMLDARQLSLDELRHYYKNEAYEHA